MAVIAFYGKYAEFCVLTTFGSTKVLRRLDVSSTDQIHRRRPTPQQAEVKQ